jgi:hypothetical protein
MNTKLAKIYGTDSLIKEAGVVQVVKEGLGNMIRESIASPAGKAEIAAEVKQQLNKGLLWQIMTKILPAGLLGGVAGGAIMKNKNQQELIRTLVDKEKGVSNG